MLAVRRLRYGLVALAVVVVAWLLYQARGALVPFLVGGVLAYMLSPLVERFARILPFYRGRPELARTIAILEVYLIGLAVLVSAGVLIIPALVREAQHLFTDIPEYARLAQERAEEYNQLYRERVPADVRARIERESQRVGQQLGALGQQVLNRTFGIVTSTFGILLGYIVIPFWLFYILKDRHKIGPTIKEWFPPGLRNDVDQCLRIVQRVLGSYIRAQLTLGLFIGVMTTAALFLLGIPFYVVLGLVAGVSELIPVIGPILGAVPAIIVTVATEPEKTWWVILFYLGLQQVENAVLVPRIQGQAVELHPALIIVLLVIAQQIAGFFGMIVVVPLAALSRDLFKYIYRRLREREEELARPRVIRLDRERILALATRPGDEAEAGKLAVPQTSSGLPSRPTAGPATGPQPSEPG